MQKIQAVSTREVTLKPQLQVHPYLTAWQLIWYHGLLWGDSIRKGADLEDEANVNPMETEFFRMKESFMIFLSRHPLIEHTSDIFL